MTDEDRKAAAVNRYESMMHAMQSGVAAEMNYRSQPTEPKHLRVGINSALVNHDALAQLLMAKGVVTEIEYLEALADAAEREKDRYEKHVRELMGNPHVTLA